MSFRWPIILAPVALAVVALIPSRGERAAAEGTAPKPTENLVAYTVHPQAAPRPALRYLLMPELAEMQPGNSLYGYLRAFYPEQSFLHTREAENKRDKWLAMPLKDLPRKEVSGYVRNAAMRGAMYAARLDHCDWEILDRLKKDGLNLLLPDVQTMRGLAAWLKLRARLEMAEGDYPAAIETLKTMFRLAHDMGQHPTLIGDLVGLAIEAIALKEVEELTQQPGVPNLYWALTNLPAPFIDLYQGLQGERVLIMGEFAGVLDRTQPMSPEQLSKCIDKMRMLIALASEGNRSPSQDVGVLLAARATNEESLAVARKFLVGVGMNEELLKRMPPLQVLILDEIWRFEVGRDEMMKWMLLPYPQCSAGVKQVQKEMKADSAHSTLLIALVPAFQKVRLAQARLERNVAILRVVEALRMYAAAHDSQLPESLAALPVPVPDDPLLGKPFGYRRDGATADVRAVPPPEETNFNYNLHYRVTIAK